ncbi:ZIP family metal transporter [Patescibacteria group bacterium]|nr:ZIP family metal transporter [Patescibacteria group bacterium]
MANFFKIIIATLLISLVSLVGVFIISFKRSFLKKISFLLVSLAAGSLMAGAFFHLLPKAAEQLPAEVLFPAVLVSFITFLLIEKLLPWRHCRQENCEVHTFAFMNLVGDAVHNFSDLGHLRILS